MIKLTNYYFTMDDNIKSHEYIFLYRLTSFYSPTSPPDFLSIIFKIFSTKKSVS